MPQASTGSSGQVVVEEMRQFLEQERDNDEGHEERRDADGVRLVYVPTRRHLATSLNFPKAEVGNHGM